MEEGDMRHIDCILKQSGFEVSMAHDMLAKKVNKSILSERVKTLVKYQRQLKKLMDIPKLEQKTEAWYKARENMISASDFAQALGEGKFGTQNQLIQKKCDPPNEAGFSNSNPFFKWGNMFEDVASSIYEDLFKTQVYSFGLIKHPKYNYFGASPDGITDLGIMLEIKCPLKRKITGDIPKQYYYQIQGQLDVCGLEECDYIECEFEAAKDLDDFEKRYSNYEYCGVVWEDDKGTFSYSPLFKPSVNDFTKVKKTLERHQMNANVKTLYWYLRKYSVQRVIRDPEFINSKMPEVKKVWDRILYYRENKDKYEIEIKNTIEIDTERLWEPPSKAIKGYSMVDMSD